MPIQCIKGIEESEHYLEGDKDMKQLLGESYCLRAYWYWMLCNFWGDVPFATTPSTKDEMHNDPRTDKNIIYTHCIQDSSISKKICNGAVRLALNT